MSDDLIAKYRKQHETERVWQIRKLFIERHKDKYSEERLLCLAQCFVNIQTMGCRYSHKIMNQIKELTEDIEPLIQERIGSSLKQNQNNKNQQQKPIEIQTPKQSKYQEAMKHKLISKTHLVNDNEVQFEKDKPKIQILTRKTSVQQTPNQCTPPKPTTYKNAVLNSLASNQPTKPLKTVPSTPSVPASTTELAPDPSTLPIPFGLSPNSLQQTSRNVLLNMLKSETNNQKPHNPLSILIGPGTRNDSNGADDLKFVRLNKINKLRDVLRSIKIDLDDNFDLIEFFDNICAQNNINVLYEQRFDNVFFGDLFIESFRLVTEENKKKKKCKYYAYKKSYEILVSPSELAVKLSNSQNFEYELYRLDASMDNTNHNLSDLNMLLKSMILPKENSNVNDDSKESQVDMEEEEDDEESKSHGLSKKNKIRQNLPNFCLFIPSFDANEQIDLTNMDTFIHERNSLQILNQSCVKSSCNLEFEIKNKLQTLKTRESGDGILAESEDESINSTDTKNFKCKCIINSVKIASANACTRTESKRLAALKATRYLSKMFPVIKETSYKTITTTSAAAVPAPTFLKISKEQLFGGLAPPTLFETPLSSLENCLQTANIPHQSLGEKLLKKMGWKGDGHGLGKNDQGIAMPVEFMDVSRTRYGLGFNYHFCDGYDDELHELDCADSMSKVDLNHCANEPKVQKFVGRNKMKLTEFIKNIRTLLNDFVSSETEKDLVFDKTLSVEDRKIIHKEAHRFGLKTRSEGSGEDRFLVVRKKQTANEILDSMMKNGGELNKYKIISTGNLQ